MNVLIVTDLDGSLLDHYTYSFTPAQESLDQIRSLSIPLIINSSKTIAELVSLRLALNNNHPFIVENGAGVVIPEGYFSDYGEDLPLTNNFRLKTFGPELSDILKIIHELRDSMSVSFRGLFDMTIAEIAELTGLSDVDALKAKDRNFSEPIIWDDSDESWQAFSEKLSEYQISHHRGGRFIHLCGGGDKGSAVLWLKNLYRNSLKEEPEIIALGDGQNDVPMLKIADIPVIIRSPVNAIPTIPGHNDMIVTRKYGPAGWNNAILKILKQRL